MVVYGVISVFAMAAISFLPESKDRPKLDEIEEISELEKEHSMHT